MSDFTDKVWAELYRPANFNEYIFPDEELRQKCLQWRDTDGVFPNLILAGIAGTGKSSLARVLINEFDIPSTDIRFIDGSVHNKVDDVRERIVNFASIAPMGTFKVVVIEESHRLTRDAQSALLETIERNSDHVRFIFTTNFPKKLLEPILSRCQLFTFNKFNEDDVMDLIAVILEDQKVDLTDEESIDNIQLHVDTFKPDIRAIISSIQYSYVLGAIHPPSASIKSGSIDEWEKIWSAENLDQSEALSMVYLADSTNFEMFYTTLYEKGLHHFENRGEAVVHVSEYLARAMSASTQGIQSIHLEALLHTLFNYTGAE